MTGSTLLGDWTYSHADSQLDLSGFHLNFADNFNTLSVGGSNANTGAASWFAPVRPTFGGATFLGPDSPASPFSVADGALTIRMEQVNGQWQSGHMQSVNSRGEGYLQQYGYFEMSAKFPAGAGSWPAFWLLSADPTKPRVEIDIVEAYGRDDPDGHHTTIHVTPTADSGPAEKVVNSEYTNVSGSMFDGQFHTYGALLTPEWIIIYYDRSEVARFPSNDYLSTPVYLCVDLAMYTPEMAAASGSYDMVIDYIRGYADPRYTGLVLNGGDGADEIVGSSHGDTLSGGAGDDTMRGGDGGDVYFVGSDFDRVIEVAGAGLDIVNATVSYSAVGQHIEQIRLTGASNINATGNELSNLLQGNGAANVLDGRGGADTMIGGGGGDTFYVDDVGDVIQDDAEAGVDHVFAAVSYSLAGYRKKLENLTLTGDGDIDGTGNDLRNVLVGNAGDNVLNGGVGDDTMQGGAGDDTYYVSDGADKVIEVAGAGNDTIISTWTLSLGNIRSVENLTLAGKAALNGTGAAGANILRGNAGANILDGREGADTISGGGGSDTLIGGTGQDVFLFDTAPSSANLDRIKDFSSADDTIHLDNAVFTSLVAGPLSASALGIGTTAANASQRIIYDKASGSLFYDADGSGAAAQVKFAQLSPGAALSLADLFVVGARKASASSSLEASDEVTGASATSYDGAPVETVIQSGLGVEHLGTNWFIA
jgi:Ca2+-binding RTX toxin-like protein